MTNIVESILERKLLQLEELQREINALRVAATLVKAEAPNSSPSVPPTSQTQSLSEKNRERTERVIELLKAAKREMTLKELANAFGITSESMKEWLHRRIQTYGDKCPWVVGKNSSSFKLREIKPSDLAFLS